MAVLWSRVSHVCASDLCLSGKDPKDEYLEAMMTEAPGPINFTMFLTMFGEKLNGTDPEEVIRNAFACFDEEGTGEHMVLLNPCNTIYAAQLNITAVSCTQHDLKRKYEVYVSELHVLFELHRFNKK